MAWNSKATGERSRTEVGLGPWQREQAEATRALLEKSNLADRRAAYRCLESVAPDRASASLLNRFLPQLLDALAGTHCPDRVLCTFERFVLAARERNALLRLLAGHPRSVEKLTTLFASSQFLTEILLRNPECFGLLLDQRGLTRRKSADDFYADARSAIEGAGSFHEKMDALRRYQRRELLRIGASDLLDLWGLNAVTEQLSNLADGVVRAALDVASEKTDTPADGFSILALGKLGGRELNYSSDIDLIFLAGANPGRFRRLGEEVIEVLGAITSEGFLYRVDMRLRPWGITGPLVSSVGAYIAYLEDHARIWEKQALLRARAIAGDEAVGEEFLTRAAPLLFFHDGNSVRESVRAMKERVEGRLLERGKEWGEVKLGQGSIRDVEFVAQYLQMVHGARHPDIRTGNTLEALRALHAHGLISTDEHRVLSDGYVFLRTVEHHLQLMHYRQTHTLPTDPDGLAGLARRLRFEGEDAGKKLVSRYEEHREAIRSVYRRHLGDDADDGERGVGHSDHAEQMPPSYRDIFTEEEVRRHALLAGRLRRDHLAEVEATPLEGGRWRLTIVGYDYFGELSAICGLLTAHGFDILEGNVFTTEEETSDSPRRIVDVFTVLPVGGEASEEKWTLYAEELRSVLRLLDEGRQREAQGWLAKRVASAVSRSRPDDAPLYPVVIEVDNGASGRYTVLRLESTDTVGFLYEFANALALNGIYISRVTVKSVGRQVQDTLYVTDAEGRKITSPEEERKLRAATALVKHFTHLLPHAPNPEAALEHFSELLGQLFSRPNWPDELASLESPKVLQRMARLLGVSDFLWDDFLRMQHENLLPMVRSRQEIAARKSKDELEAELRGLLSKAGNEEEAISILNSFKDREMFRLDMRYILGYSGAYWRFSLEMSELAEVVADAAYGHCYEKLLRKHGMPMLESGAPSPATVCALGKFGGRELGFASDIELMFVYRGNGTTSGPKTVSTAEFYESLVRCFLKTIRSRRKGVFEIDLRLRPYGRAGSLAVSLDAFRRYFAPGGEAWPYERQALVRLRPVAGDMDFGQEVVALRDRLIYTGEPFDAASMHAMRERQIRHLVTGGTVNAKYSPGGLVDLEYLVQGLQLSHGHEDRNLRVTNTRAAMLVLATAGIITPDELADLTKAHTFLRRLIEAMRMVRGNAKDLTVPPPGTEEFGFLARRMGYGGHPEKLWEELNQHMARVLELRDELLG